ncbi:hypothetical protein B0O99DRAFT_623708 [Bisporella sp. PMI_857]|nr:hypothetical protein B0O99DRAFT_623708 [Bisporella sp. PMI_857]
MASNIAFELVLNQLSTRATAMPFLYQTRTLAAIYWRKSFARPTRLRTITRRSFSGIGRHADDKASQRPGNWASNIDENPLYSGTAGRWDVGRSKSASNRESLNKNGRFIVNRTANIRRRNPNKWTPRSSHDNFPEGERGRVRRNGEDSGDNTQSYDLDYNLGSRGSLSARDWQYNDLKLANISSHDAGGKSSSLRGNSNYYQNSVMDEFGDAEVIVPKPQDSIDFAEDDNIYEQRDAIDQLTSRMDPEQDRASTITPSEKQAFQKIFSDIFARHHQQNGKKGAHSLDLFKDDPVADMEDEAAAEPATSKSLEGIMSDATKRVSKEQMETIVNRYPAALRAAAARAYGFKLDVSRQQTEQEKIGIEAMDQKLEELRKPERERVERLMRDAKTDFDLWAVMEEEVFTIISRLGLGNSENEVARPSATRDMRNVQEGELQERPNTKRGRNSKKKVDETPEEPLKIAPQEEGISALARDGPLYPSHLLLGLRLLDRSFAKPSLLTLSILPKIKSLGLLSHVLGGSTQLYNELMVIYWHRRDDFPGVLALLAEMEQSGLDWDMQTLDIVSTIDAMQRETMRGDRGEGLHTLWKLPEFAPRRFGTWREKIKQSLAERRQDNARYTIY